jgi:hypothetical protein
MYFNREAPIRGHLRNVYACIASASLVAAVGAYVHCSGKTSSHNVSEDVKMNYKLKSMSNVWELSGIWEGGILSGLGSIILITMLAVSRNPEGKADATRFMYLNGLALCTGK